MYAALLWGAAVAGVQAAHPLARRIGELPSTVGAPKIPVVLVQFQDVAFSEAAPAASYAARLGGTATREEIERGEGTAAQYFADQSYGKFTPEFVVLGPVTLDHERAYYGADGAAGRDTRMGEMMSEAVGKADASGEVEDWSVFDSDGDGVADALYVLYAGEGQHAIPAQTDLIWPHTSSMDDQGYDRPEAGGLAFNAYSCTNELLYGKLDGIGTFCHEFAHQLGLPDFYRTDGQVAEEFAMGDWSLMDRGGYLLDGRRPVGMRALERIAMGWTEPMELTEATTVEAWPSLARGGKPLKVVNDADAKEYYLLETIDGTGWDMSCPAAGLLVTHVNLSAEDPMAAAEWRNNEVNNVASRRVTIVPADGEKPLLVTGVNDEEYEENLKGDTYPSPDGNNELSDTSVPNFGAYIGWGTLGKSITGITYDAASGRVSFDFNGGSEENVWTDVRRPGMAAAEGPVRYFRLDGTRAEEPLRPGVYVRVAADGRTEKFLQR